MGHSTERPPSASDVARHFSALAEDRLHVDSVLVQHFRESGLVGPVWAEYQQRLLGYGLTIVTKLVGSGAMFARCGRHGHHLRQQSVRPHEAEELASDAVLEGFLYFRDSGLLDHQWSPVHGQPLKEYFLNACVLAFPNVYRRWQSRMNDWREVDLLDTWARLDSTVAAPEDAVITRQAVDAVFAELSKDNRTLLFLSDQNFSHAEIAEIMRLTPRAVEARIRRARLAARKHSDGEW